MHPNIFIFEILLIIVCVSKMSSISTELFILPQTVNMVIVIQRFLFKAVPLNAPIT